MHSLTILFEDPFWIGLLESIEGDQMQVCKITFGAEPTEQEVLEFLDRNWNKLKYSKPVVTEVKAKPKKAYGSNCRLTYAEKPDKYRAVWIFKVFSTKIGV